MLHGVLHEHLQGERRDQQRPRSFIHVQTDVDALLEAHFHQVVVRLREFQLGAQVHHFLVLMLENVTVDVAQFLCEARGLLGVLMDQRHQRVQAVEQEMRTDLVLQYAQFGAQVLALHGFGLYGLLFPLHEEVAGLVYTADKEGGTEALDQVADPMTGQVGVGLHTQFGQCGADREINGHDVYAECTNSDGDPSRSGYDTGPTPTKAHDDEVAALPNDPGDDDAKGEFHEAEVRPPIKEGEHRTNDRNADDPRPRLAEQKAEGVAGNHVNGALK